MRLFTILSLLVVATSALAQDGIRSSDQKFSQAKLQSLIEGQVLEFFDGSKSTYEATARYGYTYTDDGPIWGGEYSVTGASQICVEFDNGSSRCDTIVQAGERVVLITADGERYPIRSITALKE